MTLFCSGMNISKAKWEGARWASKSLHQIDDSNTKWQPCSTGYSAAKKIFQADDALPISNLPSHLKGLLPQCSSVYIDLPNNSSRRKSNWLLNCLPGSLLSDTDSLLDHISSLSRKPLAPQLGKLRSIKSAAEQAVMRKAADISARAHTKVGKLCSFLEYGCGNYWSRRWDLHDLECRKVY